MQYVLFIMAERNAKAAPDEMQRMGKFAGELVQAGKLKGGAPLTPEVQGARIRKRGGKLVVTDGPFAETKEVIGGFFVLEADSREEALEIAKRCPAAESSIVELREAIKMG
jgi:hypothetical protein